MPQDDLGGEFRIGIAEEKRVHRSFSQYRSWSLNLHSIPWMWDNSGRGPYRHTQGLEVIDPAPPPVLRPVSGELRRAFPELFIVGVVLSLSKRDLFDTIFPIPPGLILRDAPSQNHIEKMDCIAF